MTDTHASPDSAQLAPDEASDQADVDGLPSYRAGSYEDAVRAATDDLGANFRVVAANRIRRGGIGGFFATDLGVEIIVMPTDDDGVDVPPHPDEQPDDSDRDEDRDGPSTLTDTRLQQLLEAADRGDRMNVPASTMSELRTFADHLAQELRSAGADHDPRLDPVDRDTRPTDHRAIDRSDHPPTIDHRTAFALGTDIEPDAIDLPLTPTLPPRTTTDAERGASAPATAEPACAVIGDPLLPVPGDSRPQRPAARPAASRTTHADDPLRRPTQLAAAAADRLVTKLGKITPVEGSRLHDLDRVRVAVTTPDGTQIEMTAELRTG